METMVTESFLCFYTKDIVHYHGYMENGRFTWYSNKYSSFVINHNQMFPVFSKLIQQKLAGYCDPGLIDDYFQARIQAGAHPVRLPPKIEKKIIF